MSGDKSRLALAALGFAIAAALSSWNPLSAPFGLVVGLASAALAIRALVRRDRRGTAAGALALSLAAVVASALVLGLTAGLGRELGGVPVVPLPPEGDVNAELDSAGERTRPARERARSELDQLGGSKEGQAGERKGSAEAPRR